jgi:hypothetical protein
VTNANGELIVLDSAGYGPVTITQSVSIIAPPGVYAGISVFSSDGITVNGSGIKVVLRGLSISGLGGDYGINIIAAAEVHVENCIVSHMNLDGLYMHSGAALLVRDSLFRDNGGDGITQLNSYASYDNVRSDRNADSGLRVIGGAAAMSRSTLIQNSQHGVDAVGDITLESTMIHGNAGFGIFADVNGAVWANRVDVDRNGGAGIGAEGGFVLLNQSSVSRNGSIASSPDIFAFGIPSQVVLQQSVVNSASSGATVTISLGAVVYTYGNNAISPSASGLTPLSLQ